MSTPSDHLPVLAGDTSLLVANNLVSQLQQLGIVTIVISYDGYADSGSVEAITGHSHLSGDNEVPIPAAFYEQLEEFAYHLIETQFPGWEIEEGAFGTVTVNLAEKKATWTHRTRFTDTHDTAFSFNNHTGRWENDGE